MENCNDFQELIERYLAGESEPAELITLHKHCKDCRDCRQLLELHSGLLQDAEHIPEPNKFDLRAMRHGVLARIAQDEPVARKVSIAQSFWQDLRGLLRAHPVAAVPLAAAVLAAAVFIGRWTATTSQFDDRMFLQEMQNQASLQQNGDDYADLPFSYSNVSVKPKADGSLYLAFDVYRRVDIETAMDSPLAKDVLLHAMLDQSAMGSRMKAMELSPQIRDSRLEDALVFTMHNDSNLTVRLEALSVLTRHPYDQKVQNALLHTLQQDEAVQMRLLALDCLAGKQIDFETIRQTIQETEMAGDAAIMQHAMELTNEF